ncbi:MAG: NAD(P)H-hydrate dehydratase [Candidatus Marinimicrobia bacterium]|nr:NAD(P)H-hydrate dehydratase [Candidatus Neomarinimicrobiota bacterium]
MKEYILTNLEARLVDRYTIDTLGISGIDLMKRAGSFVSLKAKKFLKDVPGSHVDIFCGTGNNGGDGFVTARDLSDWGANVFIWLAGKPNKIKGDARHYFERCNTKRIKITIVENSDTIPTHKQICQSDLIIDALLGTGFSGEVRGVIKKLIELINSSKRPVLSVDIPSGINGDTAQIGGVAIQATRTVTMGFLKRGLMFQPGKRKAGDVVLVDLKYPAKAYKVLHNETFLIDKQIIKQLFPSIFDDTYKHKQGKVLIFAGSPGMTGAAILTSKAALRSGAGLVINAIPESLNSIIEIKSTETLSLPLTESLNHTFCKESLNSAKERIDWSDVIVFGPGVSDSAEVEAFGKKLIESLKKPMIIDADGLRVFHENLDLINSIDDLIITPHIGEFSQMTGMNVSAIKENVIDVCREFVEKHPCTLVLKGAPTVVVSRDGKVAVNSTGNPALATGGTGDVLTGLIAGLRAQKIDSFDASMIAVYFHGLAGDLGKEKFGVRGLIAGDLLDMIPGIMKDYERVV